MMYVTLTMLAAMISFMFVATAATSIVNSIRESEADRRSARKLAF